MNKIIYLAAFLIYGNCLLAQCPTVTITAEGPTTFCQGGSVTLQASAGNAYTWSNGANTQTTTVSTGGTFMVTVTGGASCTGTAAILITIDTSITATIIGGATAVCTGTSPGTFSVTVKGGAPAPAYATLWDFTVATGWAPNYCQLCQASDGLLYGTTGQGGTSNVGVIFSFNPATSVYTVLHNFSGTDGAQPYGSLMQASNGSLYGTTTSGGLNNLGNIFSYNLATNVYTNLFNFIDTFGYSTFGSLMQASNGLLYGLAASGGANGGGVIFSFDPTANRYTLLYNFEGSAISNGTTPFGSLIQASHGLLYGTTSQGGANGVGVIFSFDPTGLAYTDLFDFNGTTNGAPNANTGALLQANNGLLYGMTESGGENNGGVLYSYNPAAAAFTTLFNFNGGPTGSLIQATNGLLYGVEPGGEGPGQGGNLFSYNIASNLYTDLFDFLSASTAVPYGSPMQASNGLLYGMTQSNGVIFSYNIAGNSNNTFTYQWYLNGAATGITTQTYNPGNFTSTSKIYCNVSNGVCSANSSIDTITVIAYPAATITASGPTTFCTGGSVTLTANTGTGYTYNWSNTATTQAITVSTAGSYIVTVTNASGCSKASTAKKVTVDALPTATITAGSATTFCAGGSVTLSAKAGTGYKFLWSTGATNSAITATTTGSYNYTVTNASGCAKASAAKAVTVDALPTAKITVTNNKVCTGSTATLTVTKQTAGTYDWSTDATTQAISISAAGIYTVTVTNKDKCSATTSDDITCAATDDVADKIDNSGTDGANTSTPGNAQFDVSVYPNPYSGEFHVKISSSNADNIQVKIFDVNGRLLEQKREFPYGNDVILGNGYAAGVYVLQVMQGDITKQAKVVKTE